MSKGSIFTLSGTGYLNNVIHSNGNTIARINVINRFGSSNHASDDIWIDCQVKLNNLLPYITELESNLKFGKTVILRFNVKYSSFDFCHSGISKDDPNNILQLQGNLLSIDECFIDGVFHSSVEHEQFIAKIAI